MSLFPRAAHAFRDTCVYSVITDKHY